LVALARRVLRRLQGATTRHTLELTTPNEFVVVDIDVGRIEQVLTNLVHNALKYSPAGGKITVTVTDEPSVGGHPGYAMLSVHDSGIGIPASDQARLFGRFARAENARTGGIEGTGLGLFLCRELVERHGGRIWFESTTHPKHHGTTFYLTLPLVKDESEENLEAR
jgi:signal transduction histidine kinase